MNLAFTFDEELARINKALDLQLQTARQTLILGERIMSIVTEFAESAGPQLLRIEQNQIALVAEVNRLRGTQGESPADKEALDGMLARITAAADMVPPLPVPPA